MKAGSVYSIIKAELSSKSLSKQQSGSVSVQQQAGRKEWTVQPSDLNSRYENGMSMRLAEVNHVSDNVMLRRPN